MRSSFQVSYSSVVLGVVSGIETAMCVCNGSIITLFFISSLQRLSLIHFLSSPLTAIWLILIFPASEMQAGRALNMY
ncbi:hypothetical protein F5Y17DRAFT_437027 [Xylariaceae sp. FL0594]|nr:hypothetical protein F5Y17DRAFT_437027 [Xylariaceae sp. FL0594]